MSVVIVGGNECMERKYKELCEERLCKAKVFPKMKGCVSRIGTPDLLVLFTGTMSHKMLRTVMSETDESVTKVVRSHASSASALKKILETHTSGGNGNV